MGRNKVPTTFYIRRDQQDALIRMRDETSVPMAIDVRKALDEYLLRRGYLTAGAPELECEEST